MAIGLSKEIPFSGHSEERSDEESGLQRTD